MQINLHPSVSRDYYLSNPKPNLNFGVASPTENEHVLPEHLRPVGVLKGEKHEDHNCLTAHPYFRFVGVLNEVAVLFSQWTNQVAQGLKLTGKSAELFSKSFVPLSFVPASAYALTDMVTGYKGAAKRAEKAGAPEDIQKKMGALKAADAFLFQMAGSLVGPVMVMHKVEKWLDKAVKKHYKIQPWFPEQAGKHIKGLTKWAKFGGKFAALVISVKLIDKGMEKLLDNTLRKIDLVKPYLNKQVQPEPLTSPTALSPEPIDTALPSQNKEHPLPASVGFDAASLPSGIQLHPPSYIIAPPVFSNFAQQAHPQEFFAFYG